MLLHSGASLREVCPEERLTPRSGVPQFEPAVPTHI